MGRLGWSRCKPATITLRARNPVRICSSTFVFCRRTFRRRRQNDGAARVEQCHRAVVRVMLDRGNQLEQFRARDGVGRFGQEPAGERVVEEHSGVVVPFSRPDRDLPGLQIRDGGQLLLDGFADRGLLVFEVEPARGADAGHQQQRQQQEIPGKPAGGRNVIARIHARFRGGAQKEFITGLQG